jgi:hypothetical protein
MTASDKSTNHIKNVLLCRGHPHMPFGTRASAAAYLRDIKELAVSLWFDRLSPLLLDRSKALCV